MVSPQQTTVGFIGLGVMGASMAGHILEGGYPLHVYNRTRSKAQDLLDKGAIWQDSPKSLAAVCDVVITIVGFPKDVEEVYLGESGLVSSMKDGAILIDMTTSVPALAAKINDEARAKGGYVLDAPVSGSDIGARDGKLSIMVGGDREAFDEVLPLFELMGKNIVYQGKAGSGQHCKMCNQIVIASTMMGVCEAIAYAEKSGLDPEVVLKSIGAGAAGSWSLSNLAPRMIAGDFAPGFFVKHFIKDMTIASESAEGMGLDTPGLELAKKLYEKLAANGNENDGTQALLKVYR